MIGQIAGRDRLVVAVAQPDQAFVLHLPPEHGAAEVGVVRDDAHVDVHLGPAVRGLAVRRSPWCPSTTNSVSPFGPTTTGFSTDLSRRAGDWMHPKLVGSSRREAAVD